MITTINGKDTIKTLSNGMLRAHRQSAFWIGDYPTFADATRALEIANSAGATESQRGVYDGGCNATDAEHDAAVMTVFGIENRVTMDDVRRTILAGEPCQLVSGMPVRA